MTDINWWLMKSEPDAYSIDDLKKDDLTLWDGIRNYQARNFMRNMTIGDKVFFYHSNCKPPSIVGLMEVKRKDIIDPTQFDKSSKYFDPKSDALKPRWDCVEVKFISKFKNELSLSDLRLMFNEEELLLVKKGNRLSIIPIKAKIAKQLLLKLDTGIN
tara:strand:- start:181 stop:654 length:474 start_codon:yes stop_codon:yes gene_type:complete